MLTQNVACNSTHAQELESPWSRDGHRITSSKLGSSLCGCFLREVHCERTKRDVGVDLSPACPHTSGVFLTCVYDSSIPTAGAIITVGWKI